MLLLEVEEAVVALTCLQVAVEEREGALEPGLVLPLLRGLPTRLRSVEVALVHLEVLLVRKDQVPSLAL